MPPPPTPTAPPGTQPQSPPQQPPSASTASSSSSFLDPSSHGITSLDHVQRFGNASTNPGTGNSAFPNLNSLNLVSDYMYRNLHAESNNASATSGSEAHFRSRILRHFSDMHRLQSHFNELISARELQNRIEHELAVNTIPVQLRNLSRELTRNENREAYFVETTDEDDQSFQEEDEPEAIYYSDDNGNVVVLLESDESELSEEEAAAVRHDVQNNERIILASGRNGGTPYRYRSSMLSNSAIPLRRQNAIRARRVPKRNLGEGDGKPSDEKSEGNLISKVLHDEAKSLQNEILSFYQDLISLPEFQGESSLFRKQYHTNEDAFKLFFFTDLAGHFKIEDSSALHLDQKMDAYLHKRRNKQLWLKLRLPPPPPSAVAAAATSLKDKKRSKNSRSKPSTSAKRQKLVHDSNDDVAEYSDDIPRKRYLYSKSEKEAIISGLSSSFFESGSVYSVGVDSNPLNRYKLVFTDVRDLISGVFNFTPEDASPLESILLKLHNFTKFICGFNDFSQCLPRSKILVRKLNVLDRISIDKNITYKKNLKDELNIPIQGNIIDFKEHDLRFLKSRPDELSSSRFKSNRVILQLLEWMKLHPFVQFKENYFLSFVRELDKSLTNFGESKLRKTQKSQALNWAQEFKSNVHELTKDFTFINKENSSRIKLMQDQKDQKQYSPSYVALFVDEWERGLACELSEQVTKDDSTTLLNIQLNFVLFTLEIDLSKFLDSFIQFIFRHCEESRYMDNYRKVYDNVLSDEHMESDNHKAILICSIDRKSGTIEILNTLPFLHYKDRSTKRTNFILSSDQNLSAYSTRSSFVFDDFELFEGDKVPQNSYSFNTSINLGSQNTAIIDTKLIGTFQSENAVCDMV
ncbi:hypothetical protein Cantr_01933 [Candida viswanathii]|uniref:Uncharacterized protein n=1 Tax=Candida viswanathii TaxID=5486 RepID=A0A367YMB1_9ASCO|nr:hypothetical protein Cantr_01933 [Candida viswanathii]